MPFILTYLLKLSLSLGVVFLFYQFVLRKLTFYNWNRWYLVGYTLLSFLIAFIDISPVLEENEWTNTNAFNWVPVIGQYGVSETTESISPGFFTTWNITLLLLFIGMFIMLCRFLFQLISFRRMMKKAQAIPGEGMNLYQVDEEIIPFSFGNSIFINQRLHTPEELQEIIRHEFVHVKQKHSIDIIWSEILCMINWYNPFAWLLKKSIRQNLEFIADNKVLRSGIDKKQYQYLLLKVIGNNQFSIAQKFNFSSLKKRIAMMNKLKTARLHLVRFLFILPLLAVILLSFRKQIGDQFTKNENTVNGLTDTLPDKNVFGDHLWQPKPTESEKDFTRRHPNIKNITWGYVVAVEQKDIVVFGQPGDAIMTIHFKNGKWDMYNLGTKSDVEKFKKNYNEEPPVAPEPPSYLLNDKGYFVNIIGEKGNCTVVVKDKAGKEIDRLLLTAWDEKQEHYESRYGTINSPETIMPPLEPVAEDDPGIKAFLKRNPGVKNIGWVFNNVRDNLVKYVHITKKDGTEETYNLDDPEEKAKVEKKYGILPVPAPPPQPPIPPRTPGTEISIEPVKEVSVAGNRGYDLEINDEKATVFLENGTTEKYDLAKKDQLKKFEEKYGKVIHVGDGENGTIASVSGVSTLNNIVVVTSPIHLNLTGVEAATTVTGNISTSPIKVAGVKTLVSTPVTTTSNLSLSPIEVIGTTSSLAPITVTGHPSNVIAVTPSILEIASVGGVTMIDDNGRIVGGKEEIVITISKYTTREQLEGFKKDAKEKGIELNFTSTDYNTKGILTSIAGKLKSKDSQSNFSVTDFEKLLLSVITKDGKTYCQVIVKEKEVI